MHESERWRRSNLCAAARLSPGEIVSVPDRMLDFELNIFLKEMSARNERKNTSNSDRPTNTIYPMIRPPAVPLMGPAPPK